MRERDPDRQAEIEAAKQSLMSKHRLAAAHAPKPHRGGSKGPRRTSTKRLRGYSGKYLSYIYPRQPE